MFSIVDHPIGIEKIKMELYHPSAGAVVDFEGRVRDHNNGQRVSSLEYQCYLEMALVEGEKILSGAKEMFPILDACAVHRQGHLQIGEVAVWVGVISAHRDESFKACRYIIDTIKNTVPIWKKEYYPGSIPKWVACHRCKSDSNKTDILLET